jgi:hypothetical protein
MQIDGLFYAAGGLYGNLTGNVTGRATNSENTYISPGDSKVYGEGSVYKYSPVILGNFDSYNYNVASYENFIAGGRLAYGGLNKDLRLVVSGGINLLCPSNSSGPEWSGSVLLKAAEGTNGPVVTFSYQGTAAVEER